jgi:hypothetical protein
MFKEPSEGMFDDVQKVVSASPDKIGKVFCAFKKHLRLCLICEEVFTMQGSAAHATTQCYPHTKESEPDDGTLDPCSPSLPQIESSSSPGRA